MREFFLGFIKIHILHHANKEPIYGAYMMQELAHHGYKVSPGTIYPTLHVLEKNGYLQSKEHLVGGKIRKYYLITDKGKEALTETCQKIKELVDEVL
ncbi:PadR family transcriptional regulator [Effusibacillus consociatus]|uniref:PadR family transcriptional regulator n=1 Tax=Effusibacillus consociatus TaxID=1117041 RepID=A0ABV9PZ53_9BACL